MPDTEHGLDDKYKSGIWYDTYNGDYAKIQESEDGDCVELVNPETGDVYYSLSFEEWVTSEQQDFRKVSEEAVNNPVFVVSNALDTLQRNDLNELSRVSIQDTIDFKYAREQVELTEK